jgi:hypothetical protein
MKNLGLVNLQYHTFVGQASSLRGQDARTTVVKLTPQSTSRLGRKSNHQCGSKFKIQSSKFKIDFFIAFCISNFAFLILHFAFLNVGILPPKSTSCLIQLMSVPFSYSCSW